MFGTGRNQYFNLLMAVVGYVFGIYGALACAWLLGQVATNGWILAF